MEKMSENNMLIAMAHLAMIAEMSFQNSIQPQGSKIRVAVNWGVLGLVLPPVVTFSLGLRWAVRASITVSSGLFYVTHRLKKTDFI